MAAEASAPWSWGVSLEPWGHKPSSMRQASSSLKLSSWQTINKYSAFTLAIGICLIQQKESLPPPTFLEKHDMVIYYFSSRRKKSPPSPHRPVYLTAPNLFGSNKSTRNIIPITLAILKTCKTFKNDPKITIDTKIRLHISHISPSSGSTLEDVDFHKTQTHPF